MPSPRSPEQQVALITAHRKITLDIRTRLLNFLAALWGGMDSWSDPAADQLLAQLLPVLIGAERSTATATAAFHNATLGVPGSRAGRLDLAAVTGAALRGVDPQTVYRRPVIESRATYARLKKAGRLDRQQIIDQAVDAGLRRLLGTASTDLQLTATLTSQKVLQARGVQVYRRVARPGACPLCQAASDRVYSNADLLPIHSGCHCIVLAGGLLPEALQRASNADDPTGGRGLEIGESGEIGPILKYARPPAKAPKTGQGAGYSSGGGNGRPPAPPPGPPEEPIGPPERPTAADLVAEGVVGEGHEFYSAQESDVASWLDRNYGTRLRSVQERDKKFTNARNYKTPDSVDVSPGVDPTAWVTLEIKSTENAKSAGGQIRRGWKQSSRLVIEVASCSPAEANDLVAWALKRYPGIERILIITRDIEGFLQVLAEG